MPALETADTIARHGAAFSIFDQARLSNDEFEMLRRLIYNLSGINLTENKKSMLESRLMRRLKSLDLQNFSQYCSIIKNMGSNDPELRSLINAVTTNLTQFFRERHHFDYISDELMPSIGKEAAVGKASRSLKIWHAGCSTGQEPYSMAMTIQNSLSGALGGGWDIKILATDIDTNVLQTAKDGIYRDDEISSIPSKLRESYFSPEQYHGKTVYRAKSNIRDLIYFRHLNLLEDPWPLKPSTLFDIIFCRNVVIYFDQHTQKRLFARFCEKMSPGGYLFIGHSESLYRISDDFVSLKNTIYRKPF